YNGIVVDITGQEVYLDWDGTTLTAVEIPINITGTDTIDPDGVRVTQERAVANYVAPLSAKLEGGNFPYGDVDFSSYTTNNPQEMFFLHKTLPVIQDGVIKVIRMKLHRGGDLNLFTTQPTGVANQIVITGKVRVTGIVGDNTFNV